MPDETDAKKILTLSVWRTVDHQDSSYYMDEDYLAKTWNPKTCPWKKQLLWLRIVDSGDLMSTFGCYALLLVYATKNEDKEDVSELAHTFSYCVCLAEWRSVFVRFFV